jgi:uncharacterized damage-inducible protein DinB
MAIRDSILPEFDHEMATTRKLLERVPEGNPDWKPHEKSMSISRLAGHVAELAGWGKTAIAQDSLDFRPVGGPAFKPYVMTSRKQLLEVFDKNVAEARAAIAGASDEEFMKTWTLLSGGKQILAMPKIAVLRSFAINHTIHHRGQLSVYLRLNNVSVPSIYGPSADEGHM